MMTAALIDERAANPMLGALMYTVNPLVARMMGANAPHLRWVQVSTAARWRMCGRPACQLK